MFASPFARVYCSVKADTSLFFLVCVSEWDKKVDYLWAFSGSEQSKEASFLFFFFFFYPPPSSRSLPSVSPSCPHCFQRLLGWSSGRQRSRMEGWGDGGWMDRKHLSPITTDGNHIKWFTWRYFSLRAPDIPITRLNPLSDDEPPLVTFMSTQEKRNPGGNRQTGMLEVWNVCMHTHMLLLAFSRLRNSAIKWTLSM